MRTHDAWQEANDAAKYYQDHDYEEKIDDESYYKPGIVQPEPETVERLKKTEKQWRR